MGPAAELRRCPASWAARLLPRREQTAALTMLSSATWQLFKGNLMRDMQGRCCSPRQDHLMQKAHVQSEELHKAALSLPLTSQLSRCPRLPGTPGTQPAMLKA